MMQPLVSAVIPAYNRQATVEASIRSVLVQTFQNFEVIVVDDGSKDDTAEVVKNIAHRDERVRLISHRSNLGAQPARNTGIRAARGDWIAFLDSDDRWLRDSLETRIAAARNQSVQVVHSPGFVLRLGHDEQQIFEVPPLCGNTYRQVLRGGSPLFPGLLVRTRALQRVGMLDEAIIAYQEWETAIRLAKKFEFGFVPEPTFIYDCQGTDTISKNLLRGARGYEQIVRKHLRAIAIKTGARSVSQHYRRLRHEYSLAGDESSAERCKMISFLWWPNPRLPLRKLRTIIQGAG